MCGRYAASQRTDELVEEWELSADRTGEPARSVLRQPQQPPAGEPDFNMAPTKQARVVVADAQSPRQLRLLVWGLTPSWAKDPAVGVRMINARSETLLDKPAFREAAARRRCLIPATGWYEWQASPVARDARGKPVKQPFFVRRRDAASLAMAGVYALWRDPARAPDDPLRWLATFAVVTRAAEPGLDRIHDRQPLTLEPAAWDDWLDPTRRDAAPLLARILDVAPGRFAAYPVGAAVGSSHANGPQLLAPLPREQLRGAVDPITDEVIGG